MFRHHLPSFQSLNFLLLKTGFHVEDVTLQTVLGSNSLFLFVIFILECFGIIYHLFYLFFGQPSFVISDSDFLALSRSLFHCGHVQNTISVHIEGDLYLRSSSWSWWYSS